MKLVGLVSAIMSFRSSWNAWPAVWMSKFLLYRTLAPRRARLDKTDETDRSLPGIGFADTTQVSPFLIWIVLCSDLAIRARAAASSPWEPVVRITTWLSGNFLACSILMIMPLAGSLR